MDDKSILLLLFNNNVLRTHIIPYANYICSTDAASHLLETSVEYFKEPSKSLKVTLDDLDILFKSKFDRTSEELELWEDIKNLDISDFDILESVIIEYISKRLKEYFFAIAFSKDDYDYDKLEELYKLLNNIKNSTDNDKLTEDILLDNIDDCCSVYNNSDSSDSVEFFDTRISDTLATKHFDSGTINVIMGAPGKGKTQLILNQGIYVASQKKYSLHIALGDLTKRQLILRILAIVTGKSIQQISALSPEQFKSFMIKAKNVYTDIFHYLHCKTCLPNVFTGMEIIRQIEDMQKANNVHYTQIAIDYDGNIETDLSSTSKNRTKNDESKSMYYSGADIYNSFTAFAKKNNSVIWILSQPKIQYWSSEKLPLEALSESSKKGQIVDFCMSIGKKDVSENIVTFFISKNRHGSSNLSFKARTLGECQRFEPINNWND